MKKYQVSRVGGTGMQSVSTELPMTMLNGHSDIDGRSEYSVVTAILHMPV